VPLAELPGILVRLRDHAGDPAAAWPAGVRSRLPGPLGMYATLAGILATPSPWGCWRGGCTCQGSRNLPAVDHRNSPCRRHPDGWVDDGWLVASPPC
jgi:hypothetical protein